MSETKENWWLRHDDCIEILDDTDFDIQHILDCGQVFRYKKTDFGYKICAKDQQIDVICQKVGFKIFSKNLDFVEKYFDLYNNYANIKSDLLKSNLLNSAISYGHGIRILNQDPLEMIISFIISANNNIPRIKKIIEAICTKVGENKGDYFAFPTLDRLATLSVEDYRAMGCGYRSTYLYDTVKKLVDGFDIDSLYGLSTDSARTMLMTLKGVGRKVAECILLFAYHKTDVFPTDTWIVKLYRDWYNEDRDAKYISTYFTGIFGKNSGYAQQYVYYEKMNNRGEKNE